MGTGTGAGAGAGTKKNRQTKKEAMQNRIDKITKMALPSRSEHGEQQRKKKDSKIEMR